LLNTLERIFIIVALLQNMLQIVTKYVTQNILYIFEKFMKIYYAQMKIIILAIVS